MQTRNQRVRSAGTSLTRRGGERPGAVPTDAAVLEALVHHAGGEGSLIRALRASGSSDAALRIACDDDQTCSVRGAIRAEATAREFLEALTGVPGPLRWSIARRGEVVLVARSPAATPEPEFDDTPQGTVATLRSGNFGVELHLDKLSGARIVKDLGDYVVHVDSFPDGSAVCIMLEGSVPSVDAIRGWRDLRQRFGEEVPFEGATGEQALFSFSDA